MRRNAGDHLQIVPDSEMDNELLRTICKWAALACATILPVLAANAAEEYSLRGSIKLFGGYTEHPIGISEETDAGYLSQALSLAGYLDRDLNRFKLGYDGYASQFGNDTNLDSQRHALGVEWYRLLPAGDAARAGRFAAGVQAATRKYNEFYATYDYDEFYAYLAVRKYLGVRTLFKVYGAIRIRDYGNYVGESYREPHGKLEIQRFFDSRTTLGLSVRYGAKYYYGVAASEVWETLNLPSTSQLSTRLNFSQGMGDRVGLRSWFEYRHNFEDYPHYVGLLVDTNGDIVGTDFDSPLLDRYAREGYDVFAALKVLAPGQVWIEAGASYADYDYGGLLFPSDEWVLEDPGQARTDQIANGYLRWTRQLAQALRRPKLVVTGGWQTRDSSVDRYTYSGYYGSGSLAWNW